MHKFSSRQMEKVEAIVWSVEHSQLQWEMKVSSYCQDTVLKQTGLLLMTSASESP